MPRPDPGSQGSGHYSTRSTRSVVEQCLFSENRSVMRCQCDYVQTSHFGAESQSLTQRSEEIETVEKLNKPVGCFYEARWKRDETVSAASRNPPVEKSSKKKKKSKKLKQKKNEQSAKDTNQMQPGSMESPSKNGQESVNPGLDNSEAVSASGTVYFSCEDIEMSDSTLKLVIEEDKTISDLGSSPDFTGPVVTVTGQIRSVAMQTVCAGSIDESGQTTGDSRPSNPSQESASSLSNVDESPTDEGKEEGELEDEAEEFERAEQESKIPHLCRIITRYFPLSDRCHVLLMQEKRDENGENPKYTWDIDSNYDPGLILAFELEYQRQDEKWPGRSYEWMWPGFIEAVNRFWPFESLEIGETTAPRPSNAMLTPENAQIWPLYATPYSAYLVEQFCSFMLYAPRYDKENRYVPDEKFLKVWDEA